MNIDSNLPAHGLLSDKELCDEQKNISNETVDTQPEPEPVPKISKTKDDFLKACDTIRQYLMEQVEDNSVLLNLVCKAEIIANSKTIQPSIKSYFN